MSVMAKLCSWIAEHRPEASFRTRDPVDALGIDVSQISNALRTLTDSGAVRIVTGNGGRGGNVYQVRNLQAVRLRTFASNTTSEPAASAPAPVAADPPDKREPDFLTYAVDHDGDLQIIRPDGEMYLIDNENARRLVAFVALQASAILSRRINDEEQR